MRWKFGCLRTLTLTACLVGLAAQSVGAQLYYSNGSSTNNNRTSTSRSGTFSGLNGSSGSGLGSMFGSGSGTTFGGSTLGGTTFGGGLNGDASHSLMRRDGNPGLGPAPGVSSFTGMGMTPSQYSYYYGNTNTRYGMPVGTTPLGVGYYQLGGMAGGMSYWRAPSGYYYPWGAASLYGAAYPHAHVTYVYQGGSFAESKPSVPSVINDLRRFLEDAKSKQQLDDSNYEQLTIKLNDITEQTRAMSQNNGGLLNVSDEQTIRQALDALITEITRSLNP